MNTLAYTFKSITTDENLGLASLDTPIGTLWVLLLAAQDVRVGMRGNAYFKPTQVLLAPRDCVLCAHNCFQSRITHIKRDKILSLVGLEGGINALVPTHDVGDLDVGDYCSWYVNPSDILLEFATTNATQENS